MNISEDVYNRIISAKKFIDSNFEEPITLSQIAGKAFISRFHFHRLFSKIYKITPHEYLRVRRIEKAKALLAGNIRINSVCNSVGFESKGSFSSLFKKQTGYAPQFYRNMAYLKKKRQLEQPVSVIPFCFMENSFIKDHLTEPE